MSITIPELGHKLNEHFSQLECPGLKKQINVKVTDAGTVKACINQTLGCKIPKDKRPEVCLVGKKLLEAYTHA